MVYRFIDLETKTTPPLLAENSSIATKSDPTLAPGKLSFCSRVKGFARDFDEPFLEPLCVAIHRVEMFFGSPPTPEDNRVSC